MKRSEVKAAQEEVRGILTDAGIPIPPDVEIEIADFGLNHYRKEGLGIVVRINEPEYCSKWLTLLPGQVCPWHHHDVKKETFFIHKGVISLWVEEDGKEREIVLKPGERYTLRQGQDHMFTSAEGAVIEEVSTHDENADSIFRNPNILRDPVIEEDGTALEGV